MNGGHAQFVANKGKGAGVIGLISEGLSMLGLPETEVIFSDLLTFSTTHPKRFANGYGNYPEIDPFFHELDDRFYARPQYAVTIAVAEWLKSRPWLSIVSDDAHRWFSYPAFFEQLIPDHPMRDARRALRKPMNESQFKAALASLMCRCGHGIDAF